MFCKRWIYAVFLVLIVMVYGVKAYGQDNAASDSIIESIRMIDSHAALVVFKAPIYKDQQLLLTPLGGAGNAIALQLVKCVSACSGVFDLCSVPPAKYYISGEGGNSGIARAIRYCVDFQRIDCLKPNNIMLNGTLKARAASTYNGILQPCQEMPFDRCGSADCNGVISFTTASGNGLKITTSSAFPVSTLAVGVDLYWNESAFAKSRHSFLGGLANKLVKTGLAAASEITALIVKNDAAKTNYAVAGILIQGFSELAATDIPTIRLGSGSRSDIINAQTCTQFFDCDRTIPIKNPIGDCTLHYTVKITLDEL